jgi:poly-gamma-glutamate synthesis protein (capsule biosynthesis protein)
LPPAKSILSVSISSRPARRTVFFIVAIFLMALLHPNRCAAQRVVINAAGDIMLAGRLAPVVAARGADYPFRGVAPLLRQGDLAMGNLEAPLSRRGTEFTGKRFRFRASPASAAALKTAGLSLVTLANNHIMDYGAVALEDTLMLLGQQGIAAAGAGPNLASARRPHMATVKGKRLAFLAYSLTQPTEFFATAKSPGTAPAIPRVFDADIRAAKKGADHIIVSFHWGMEGAAKPTAIQQLYARRAIDAGADVVIGHHPHVLQGMEYYRQGVIIYSLGNLVFGSRSRTADLGAIARITLGEGLPAVELIPLNLRFTDVHFQPRPLSATERPTALARIVRLAELVGARVTPTAAGLRLLKPGEYQIAEGIP